MKRHPTGTAYFLMVIFVFLMVFLVLSFTYDEMKVKLMPALVSAITLVLTAVALVQELNGAEKTNGEEKPAEEAEHKKTDIPLSRFLNAFGWFFLQVAAVYLLGFYLAIPLWIFFYLWKHGHRWWSALLQGAGSIVVVYLVFVLLLQVELYPGWAWEMFSRYCGF